jgi:D-xylose reductase
MEELVHQGLVKQIGVCNYNSGLLHDLMSYASIQPAQLQIECHPYLTQQSLLRLAKDYGMSVTAFSPFGALSYVELGMAAAEESVLLQDIVIQCAEKYTKTPAQIVLRWGVQRGCSVITKTTKVERLKENLDVFNFNLTEQEMEAISGLNKNRRFNDPGKFCEAAFNTFYPIYD